MVKCIIGPPVFGKELFGRDKELEKIWDTIETGSALLISPRRFGKTSIVMDMRYYPKPGYRVCYLDVESLDRPESLIVEILNMTKNLENITTKFKDIFRSSINQIEEFGVGELKIKLRELINPDWTSKGNYIFEKISSETEYEYIFVLDELPSMLINMMKNPEGVKTTKLFLNWLREIRNNYKVKFIICGSIGIDQVVEDCDSIAAINDLERIVIGSLTKELSKKLIEDLFNGYGIKATDDMTEIIYGQVGGVPFFIKLLIKYVAEEMGEKEPILSSDIISDAYNKKILGIYGREYFKHYFTRLDNYEGKFGNAPKSILDILASRKTISMDDLKQTFFDITKSNDDKKFINLVERLENDFYITVDHSTKACTFHTQVLCDLWKKRRVI